MKVRTPVCSLLQSSGNKPRWPGPGGHGEGLTAQCHQPRSLMPGGVAASSQTLTRSGQNQAGRAPQANKAGIPGHPVSNHQGVLRRPESFRSHRAGSANLVTPAGKRNTHFLGTEALLHLFNRNSHFFGIKITVKASKGASARARTGCF